MRLKLHIWRQKKDQNKGHFESHDLEGLSPDMSFLEMLDRLNENLAQQGKSTVAFDHDCREGICGSCSLVINGEPHGPHKGSAVCQLHLRSFKDGEEIWVEPFRAKAFSVIQDLIVDRGAFDRLMQAGGYISVKQVLHRRHTLCRWRNPKRMRLLPILLALAVGLVWQCVPMLLPAYLCRLK